MNDTLNPDQALYQTQYEKLGGEQGVLQLVKYFYDEMDGSEDLKELRATHSEDLTETREKLFLFLSGWLGGPSLYIEKHGHPRLRARHLPFKIGIIERDQWLHCMSIALRKVHADEITHHELMQAFFKVADFMRNQ